MNLRDLTFVIKSFLNLLFVLENFIYSYFISVGPWLTEINRAWVDWRIYLITYVSP